jgi:hypothetical protein
MTLSRTQPAPPAAAAPSAAAAETGPDVLLLSVVPLAVLAAVAATVTSALVVAEVVRRFGLPTGLRQSEDQTSRPARYTAVAASC